MKSYLKIKDKKNCYGCFACAEVCPKKCITMVKDEKGFYYPKIDKTRCINCGACERICPKINKEKINNCKDMIPYYAYSSYRNLSTSGGIFPVLAKYVIENDGVVFGVRYNEQMQVVYDMIDKIDDIKFLVGSKYVRADSSKVLKKVKEQLQNDKLVLFVGIPCQVHGLKNYLRKDYKKLILCDLFCHSTPSPLVFENYIKYLEEKYHDKIIDINFRYKEDGWLNSKTRIYFKNKFIDATQESLDNLFISLFYKSISTRECCSDCDYPNLNRAGDITIADFWGVDKFYSDLDYNEGISLLLLNNEKGKKIYQLIKKYIVSGKIKHEEVLEYNHNKKIFRFRFKEYFFRKMNSNDIVIAYKKVNKRVNNDKKYIYHKFYILTDKINQVMKKIKLQILK